MTACQIHGDTYNGYHKIGLVGGFFVSAELSEKTSADLGIIFIQKGSRKNINPDKNDYSYYYLNLNYVEVPFVLRYKINKYYVTGGASFGYLISHYEESNSGVNVGFLPFEKYEYSFNVGLGRKLGERWDVEVRSNNSFKTIRKFQIPVNYYINNWVARKFNKGYYNNILEIIFSYRINLVKNREPQS